QLACSDNSCGPLPERGKRARWIRCHNKLIRQCRRGGVDTMCPSPTTTTTTTLPSRGVSLSVISAAPDEIDATKLEIKMCGLGHAQGISLHPTNFLLTQASLSYRSSSTYYRGVDQCQSAPLVNAPACYTCTLAFNVFYSDEPRHLHYEDLSGV